MESAKAGDRPMKRPGTRCVVRCGLLVLGLGCALLVSGCSVIYSEKNVVRWRAENLANAIGTKKWLAAAPFFTNHAVYFPFPEKRDREGNLVPLEPKKFFEKVVGLEEGVTAFYIQPKTTVEAEEEENTYFMRCDFQASAHKPTEMVNYFWEGIITWTHPTGEMFAEDWVVSEIKETTDVRRERR